MDDAEKIAPERITEDGIQVKSEERYYALDLETRILHRLGTGFEDYNELFQEAASTTDTDSFHVMSHVVRVDDEASLKECFAAAERLNPVSDELLRAASHPALRDVTLPENPQVEDLTDEQLLLELLRQRIRDEQLPSPDPDLVLYTSSLIEEMQMRGYDFDQYGSLADEQLVLDIAGE